MNRLKLFKILSHPQVVALFICLIITLIPFFIYQPTFTTKTDINTYAQKYANSQYIKGESSSQKISDGELYVYAGYAYMRGEDPTTINFEHPPLFKYLFGLSYLVFNNSYIISLIYFFIFLFSAYLFSGLILKNQVLRYLSVIILGLQPLVYVLASYTLLDLPLNFLILFLFYFLFKKDIHAKKRHVIIGILLGLLCGVKYPFPFMLLPISLVTLVSFFRKELKYLIYPFLIIPTIYLVQYVMFFVHDHSLIDFLNFEKYRLAWWTGDRSMPKFLIFQNLFTGQYPAWWDNKLMMRNKEWNLFLPVLFLLYLNSFIFGKKKKTTIILFGYSLTVFILYGIGSAVYLRYLTQIMPFWIVITLSYGENFLKNNKLIKKYS